MKKNIIFPLLLVVAGNCFANATFNPTLNASLYKEHVEENGSLLKPTDIKKFAPHAEITLFKGDLTSKQKLATDYVNFLVPSKLDVAMMVAGKEMDNAIDGAINAVVPNAKQRIVSAVPVTRADGVGMVAIFVHCFIKNSLNEPDNKIKINAKNAALELVEEIVVDKATEYLMEKARHFCRKNIDLSIDVKPGVAVVAKYLATKTIYFGVGKACNFAVRASGLK